MKRRAFLAIVVGLLGLAAVLAWPLREKQVERHVVEMLNRTTDEAQAVVPETVTCRRDAFSLAQLRSAFRCSFQTACGHSADVVVLAEPWRGVYRAGDPLAEVLLRQCPDMLPDDVRRAQATKVDQGG
jgi:hypothetical protein